MSKKKGHRSGHITYTGRGFRQDAMEAMGSDIVRGIIELVTNADDAYARGESGGKIWIGVDHAYKAETRDIVVRDRAGGLKLDDGIRRLTYIAERSSGFEEGKSVRGNRGRGAKDLIGFGEVEFESICDKQWMKLELHRDGRYDGDEHTATADDRARLHIRRGGGLQATVHAERTFKIPRHERLVHLITHDFQLRDIVADPEREVLLDQLNNRTPAQRLVYEPPRGTIELLDTTITVPGYPEAGEIRLRVNKLPERCDALPTDRTRPCGILIAGKRAIYDNTLLRFEGVPHAGWLAGRLDCPFIDELALAWDDRDETHETHPEANPIQIISRRRQGLAADHPFTKALNKAIEAELDPLIAQLEEDSRAHARELESARNRRLLDRLARDMAKLMAESLRELEEEDESGKKLAGPLPLIHIVPERLRLPIGETKGLSVICSRDGIAEGDEVLIELDPAGVAEIVDGPLVPLGPHRTRPDEGLSARVRLKGLRAEEAIVTASVNGRSEVALVVGCEPVEEEPPTPPETLEWEKPRLKVAVNKVKTIELRAPAEQVEAAGTTVALSIDAEGILLRRRTVELELDEELGWFTANVRVEGRALGAKGKLVAELGEATATCSVNVAERDDGIPELRIEYSDEDPIAFRAYFDPPDPGPDGSQTLRILVRHPGVRQILGKDLSGQDSVEWLTLLPEIVCDTMVRRLMGRKHPISEEIDAPSLYADHAEWHMKLLPKVQKLVLALAGAERIGTAENGDAPDSGIKPVSATAIALAARRAERSPRPPKPQARGQMSLNDEDA